MKDVIKPPFVYIGAKTAHLDWIFSFFPEHDTFVDVFGGSGSVIMNKVPGKNDVYNDINGRLCNFYRVLRDEYKRNQLQDLIALTPYSREEFKDDRHKTSEDDVEDARLFYTKQGMSFSGCGHSFGYVRCGGVSTKLGAFYNTEWGGVVKRMQSVTIDNLPFEKMFENYDDKNTLFYCDPPYVGTRGTDEYSTEFGEKELDSLVECMKGCKGYVILSGYPHEKLEALLKDGWEVERKDVACTFKNSVEGIGKVDVRRTECLYLNPRVVAEVKNRFLFR